MWDNTKRGGQQGKRGNGGEGREIKMLEESKLMKEEKE
jgi:hypothetical protein